MPRPLTPVRKKGGLTCPRRCNDKGERRGGQFIDKLEETRTIDVVALGNRRAQLGTQNWDHRHSLGIQAHDPVATQM